MQKLLQNKKLLGIGSGVLVVLLLGVWFLGVKTPAYAVYINNKPKFIVKDASSVNIALAKITKQQSVGHNNLKINCKVDLKRTFVKRDTLLDANKVETELKKNLQFKTMAAAIVVNGKNVAYVDNKAAAEKLIQQIKNENSSVGQGEKLISAAFVEKVSIKETQISLAEVLSPQGAWNKITTGTASPEKYKIQEGDSLWSIARKNDMYVADILKANHLQENDILDLGQEIILIKSKPHINVIAKVEGSKTEPIPYETKIVTDRNAASSIKVKSPGANGEKQVAYVLSKRNGTIEKKDIVSEKIIKNPSDRVVVKGSRVIQVASRGGGGTIGSGNLDWPVQGSITQFFGRHTGIDIAGSIGSAIRAADSGTVVFAGREGGYGNFVIINHGNGLVTRYAHCSSIAVSQGQSVSRGQTIATRGSTGNSTGPHLHFEVVANGSFVNPLNYLR